MGNKNGAESGAGGGGGGGGGGKPKLAGRGTRTAKQIARELNHKAAAATATATATATPATTPATTGTATATGTVAPAAHPKSKLTVALPATASVGAAGATKSAAATTTATPAKGVSQSAESTPQSSLPISTPAFVKSKTVGAGAVDTPSTVQRRVKTSAKTDPREWKEHPFEEPLDLIQTEQLNRDALIKLAALTRFSHATLRQLHDIFLDISESGVDDGEIDAEELTAAMGLAPNSLMARTMFRLWDVAGSKRIDFQTWVQTLSSLSEHGSLDDKIKFSFQLYDLNGDGTIDKTELRDLLVDAIREYVLDISEEQAQRVCDHTLASVDLDGNGVVQYEEYHQMIKSSAHFLHSFTLDVGDLCRNFRWTARRTSLGGAATATATATATASGSTATANSASSERLPAISRPASGDTPAAGTAASTTPPLGTATPFPLATTTRSTGPVAVPVPGVGRLVLVTEEEAEQKKRAFAAQKKPEHRANSSAVVSETTPCAAAAVTAAGASNPSGAATPKGGGLPFSPPPFLKQGSAPVSIGTVQLPRANSKAIAPAAAAAVQRLPSVVRTLSMNSTDGDAPPPPQPAESVNLSRGVTAIDHRSNATATATGTAAATDSLRVAIPPSRALSPGAVSPNLPASAAATAVPTFLPLFSPDDDHTTAAGAAATKPPTQTAAPASPAPTATATAAPQPTPPRTTTPPAAATGGITPTTGGEEIDDFVVITDMAMLDDDTLDVIPLKPLPKS